jgi:hypothetical protein
MLVEDHKRRGNDLYGLSSKERSSPKKESLLKEACIHYGKALEEMMRAEDEEVEKRGRSLSIAPVNQDDAMRLKQQLFLNLGMSNYSLHNYLECQRCCNAAMVFCNEPDLLLSDLGRDHDLTSTIHPLKPVVEAPPLSPKRL